MSLSLSARIWWLFSRKLGNLLKKRRRRRERECGGELIDHFLIGTSLAMTVKVDGGRRNLTLQASLPPEKHRERDSEERPACRPFDTFVFEGAQTRDGHKGAGYFYFKLLSKNPPGEKTDQWFSSLIGGFGICPMTTVSSVLFNIYLCFTTFWLLCLARKGCSFPSGPYFLQKNVPLPSRSPFSSQNSPSFPSLVNLLR